MRFKQFLFQSFGALVICVGLNSCKFIRTVRAIKATQKVDVTTPLAKEEVVPFIYSNQGWIVIPVKIKTPQKSIIGDFFYDSGAITMLAHDSLYRVLEAQNVSGVLPIPASTVFGTKYDTLSEIKSAELQIGKVAYRLQSLKADRKSHFAEDSLVGVIGPSLFANQRLMIDFEKKQLVINPHFAMNDEWKKLKMRRIAVGRNPVIESLRIGGLPVRDWFVDTGNPLDLLIQTRDKDFAGLSSSFQPYQLAQKERLMDAAGHLGDSLQYRFEANMVGGQESNRFTFFATHIKEDKKVRANNMGVGFMKKVFSQVIFDGPNKTFYYRLAPVRGNESSRLLSEVALTGTNSDSVFVRAIAINSTWFKQGLRADDFITAINGKPVSYWLQHLDEFRKTDYESFEFIDNGVRRTIYK